MEERLKPVRFPRAAEAEVRFEAMEVEVEGGRGEVVPF